MRRAYARLRRRRGFLLVEVVLALALVALVAVSAMRLTRVLSASLDARRDAARSLFLAEAIAAEAERWPPQDEDREGSFDIHPDYTYRLHRDDRGAPASVTITGPRRARVFLLRPPGEPLPARGEEAP